MSFRTFEECTGTLERIANEGEENTHWKCAMGCLNDEKLQMEQTSQKKGGKVKTDCTVGERGGGRIVLKQSPSPFNW